MDPKPIVFDISSDDESSGGREEPKGHDYDWLAEFLGIDEDGDGKHSGEDSDDVVVLREVKPTAKSKSWKPTIRDEDDDDDCVVLDGDPDNPAVDGDSSSSGGSDELLIVGEKGQIACRDFPHSRHLCATFPFSSSPHEKHCNLCHCYVCDSPAPCALWSTCNSGFDHCHATDKEETWKTQRKSLKLGKNAPLPAPKLCDTNLQPFVLPQVSQPLNIARLSPNLRPQNPVSRPVTIQGGSSTNFCVSTISSRSRNPQSGLGLSKNRFQPRIVSGGSLHGVNPNIQRGKAGQLIGNSSNSLLHPLPSTFKRQGSNGVLLAAAQTAYAPSNNQNCVGAGQYFRTPTPTPVLNNSNTIRWENVNPTAHQISSGPNLVTPGALSTPTSQQQLFTQPIPPTDKQVFHQHDDQFKSNCQSIYQYGNETQNSGRTPILEGIQSASAKAASSIDYDPSLVINACQNNQLQPNQQQAQPPPVEHMELQGTEPSKRPLVESNSEFIIGDTNLFSDSAFDWHLDDPFVPVVSDGSCMPSQSNNIFSPEPTSIDAGFLFDFETSWNELTHV